MTEKIFICRLGICNTKFYYLKRSGPLAQLKFIQVICPMFLSEFPYGLLVSSHASYGYFGKEGIEFNLTSERYSTARPMTIFGPRIPCIKYLP